MVRRGLILALGAVMGIAMMWTGAPDVSAQNSGQTALTFDSGVVPLGPNQVLRVTVTNVGALSLITETGIPVRFRLRITGTNPQVRISGQIVDAPTGVIQDYYSHSNWATFPSS